MVLVDPISSIRAGHLCPLALCLLTWLWTSNALAIDATVTKSVSFEEFSAIPDGNHDGRRITDEYISSGFSVLSNSYVLKPSMTLANQILTGKHCLAVEPCVGQINSIDFAFNTTTLGPAKSVSFNLVGQDIPNSNIYITLHNHELHNFHGTSSFSYQNDIGIDNIFIDLIPGRYIVSNSAFGFVNIGVDNMIISYGKVVDDVECRALIAQYQEYEVFDVAHGSNLFVPKCAQFTKAAHTAHYSFHQLLYGNNTGPTDKCNNPIQNLALLSPALLAGATQRRGLDKWVDGIMEDRLAPSSNVPTLNSAYRGPERNDCVDGRPGSRHQFGDAADLGVGGGDQARKAIVQRWHKIARVKAKADWTEVAEGNPCSLVQGRAPNKNWTCAHADWRFAKDTIRMQTAKVPATAAEMIAPVVTPAMRERVHDRNWRERKRVFDSLNLLLPELGTNAAQLEQPSSDPKLRQLLFDLLSAEANDDSPSSDERESYIAALSMATARLAGPSAVPLVLKDGKVNLGRYYWNVAAGLHDAGVSPLLLLMKNPSSDLYIDYLGVACSMLRLKTVRQPVNQVHLAQAIKVGATHNDALARYLAAECLPLVPKAEAVPLLRTMRDHDVDAAVRDQAQVSLHTLGG